MTCADCSSDSGLLLALNGADERLQLALGRIEDTGVAFLAAQEWTVPGSAVRFLAPGIRHMLDSLGLTANNVRRIACVTGPGSFTGLRMSLALAQGLAAGTGAELAGLNHLELLAAEAARMLEQGSGAVASLVWSRRGQVYAQAFTHGQGQAVAAAPPQVLALTALPEFFATLPKPLRLLGGGLRRNLPFFEELAGRDASLRLLPTTWDAPRPATLLDLASRAGYGLQALEPVYLRASDAEDNLAAIAAGRGLSEADAQAILDRGSRPV
ncbi:MAG: tRNA (adenosine(37)-N6)-threonylcarbamoyltransferase complex dimerization subunit type 1 TsaB [Humidesulfovibrio sp.]|uniref:tRNA (adenosine(37)-N6)-threonylcarbamoyltransferase complex dimerization subunit type 1 TsaB n=1 Tax=Humidesulfovibrio sp. TaxID=2910988 RepID=UPI0027F458C7|nr:tRNA (adenosine(37)-N6)-threonylcarbamoyltransferase complex dimerization subunit type 1 TsaB [Humidesulfovibrio sp.]MDQ7833894.1 tRNA (adenosine(37)-N6)-threonylcarbamoyltransferase complex dimerization subunit type 1 TsaB [Humidesulfovibrio sp.]